MAFHTAHTELSSYVCVNETSNQNTDMNTHPDTLNGKTYAELLPLIPTTKKIYPMKKLCGETAEKICDILHLPDSGNDDTLRTNLSKFFKGVAAQELDKRHGVTLENTGQLKPMWVFRFCDEWQSSHEIKADAEHVARFFEYQRERSLNGEPVEYNGEKYQRTGNKVKQDEPKPRIKFNEWGQVTEHFLETDDEGNIVVKDGRTLEEYVNDPRATELRKKAAPAGTAFVMIPVEKYQQMVMPHCA